MLKLSRHVQDQLHSTGVDLPLLGDIGYSTFTQHWRAAVRAAGLPAGTRYHALRHWYGSCLVRAGMNVKLVQSRMGHSSAVMTLDTYASLWPADADLGRGVISAALQNVRVPVRATRG
jgi:integrase